MKRLLCFFGWHEWVCSMEDYIFEFGYVPLDKRVCKSSKCCRCGKKYKQ